MSDVELQQRLKANLNKHTRTALLAECASRVIKLYDLESDGRAEVARSIEIAWDYACDKPIDQDEYQKCLDVIHELSSHYIDEGDDLLADTVVVFECLLESISPNEEEACLAVVKGLYSMSDAATSAEDMADDETPIPDRESVASDEEEAWQEKAIALAGTWDGVASRDMFDVLGGKPTAWILDWEARCDLE